jgi:hypothetical protein
MAVSRTRARELEYNNQPKSDAYTGMLAISLVAMLVGCTLLYLDYASYPSSKPPSVPSPAIVVPTSGSPGSVPTGQ